jgi:hypothetical protein
MFIAGGGDRMEEFNGRQFMASDGSCIWLLERRRLFFLSIHPSHPLPFFALAVKNIAVVSRTMALVAAPCCMPKDSSMSSKTEEEARKKQASQTRWDPEEPIDDGGNGRGGNHGYDDGCPRLLQNPVNGLAVRLVPY